MVCGEYLDMKDETAIKVHDLHKSFDYAENKSTSIKQLLVNAGKGKYKAPTKGTGWHRL